VRPFFNSNQRGNTMLGAITLFNKQNCDGCVMADDGIVMFFHRACVAPGYEPKVGDRVTFQWRVSPRGTGGQEAYQIAPVVKSAA
jgi:hypothetical protein